MRPLLFLAQATIRTTDNRMVPLLGISVAIGLILIVLTLLKLVRRKSRREDEEERQKMVEEGIKLGHLTKDGFAACVICGTRATENAPQTGHSWLDGISFLSRLFGLPPRYIIIDAEGRGFEYCKVHKDVAVAQLEQFHGLLRAERAAFNAEQAGKVAKMDGGGVQLKVRQHYNEVIDQFKMTDKDYEQMKHLLPVASQSDHTAVSTLSSMPKEDDPLDFSDVS